MRRVFSRALSLFIATTTTCFTYVLLAIVIPQESLIGILFSDSTIPFLAKLRLVGELSAGAFDVRDSQNIYSAFISILIGLNVALLVFFLRMYRTAPRVVLAQGVGGFFAALIGFGCGACGTVFLTSFVSSGVGVGLISYTPFGAKGIAGFGILLLILSIVQLVRHINRPVVCPI